MPRSSGALLAGPSLSLNGQMMPAPAPDVASQRLSNDQESECVFDGYPVMRMSFLSSTRQACRACSCIAVTRNRPSGETEMERWEPFHSNRSGSTVALGNHKLAPP